MLLIFDIYGTAYYRVPDTAETRTIIKEFQAAVDAERRRVEEFLKTHTSKDFVKGDHGIVKGPSVERLEALLKSGEKMVQPFSDVIDCTGYMEVAF